MLGRSEGPTMTERQWWQCIDPNPMLAFLSPATSERKRRLLACAFCRDIGQGVTDGRYWRAIELGERWADGDSDEAAVAAADLALFEAHNEAYEAGNLGTSFTLLEGAGCLN